MHLDVTITFHAVLLAFFGWSVWQLNVWYRSHRAEMTQEEREEEDGEIG